MSIFLCSHSEAVRGRWYNALVDLKKEVYQVTSVDELFNLSKGVNVDLLLLHRDLAHSKAVYQLRQSMPDCKIFILSNRPDQSEGLEFLQYGVVGYANTHIAGKRLAEAVQAILTGSVWIGQELIHFLIRKTFSAEERSRDESGTSEKKSALEVLSDREYEIANLVAQGLSNSDIADRLTITDRTVKAHLSSIYSKTGTKGRLNLALLVNREK